MLNNKIKNKLFVILFFCLFSIKNFAGISVKDFIVVMPEFLGGVQRETIWKEPDKLGGALENQCSGDPSCLANFLSSHGANKQAVAFASVWGAVITDYKNYGNIYAIKAWLPGARLREGVYLGNAQGEIFQIDNWMDEHSYLRRNYPGNDTRYGCEFPPKLIKQEKAGQRLVCIYPVVGQSGIINARAEMAFDFAPDGKFLNYRFLKIQGVKNAEENQ